MRKSPFQRRTLTSLFLAFSLLFAQFAIASHPLHLAKKADGPKVELTCAFCVAGSHLQSGPSAPAFHFESCVHSLSAVAVRHVCDDVVPVTSRVTRGPPSLSLS